MSKTIPYPLINGARHDWSSLELKIGTGVWKGITEVKYQDSLKGAFVYGASPQPVGETTGVYEASGSITMLLAEATKLTRLLSPGFKQKRFDFSVSYSESWYDTITDQIIGARITDSDGGATQGPDGLVKTFPLTVLYVVWNGDYSLVNQLNGIGVQQ